MLYKFKSQVTADLIMLQPNAEELLKIIGKAPGATGIVTAAQAPAAIAALKAEVERREAQGTEPTGDEAESDDGKAPAGDGVSLRRRALPFIDMLQQASGAGKDVVWGV